MLKRLSIFTSAVVVTSLCLSNAFAQDIVVEPSAAGVPSAVTLTNSSGLTKTVVVANDETCSNVVSIDSLRYVLYKPSNLHGARGPTFLVQNPRERTGKRVIEVRDVNCKRIGSFGLFATDFPFGARYYQRSGGSRLTAEQLLARARLGGSNAILVEGKNKWIRVNNPLNRQGTIKK